MYGNRIEAALNVEEKDDYKVSLVYDMLFSRYTFDVPAKVDKLADNGVDFTSVLTNLRGMIDTERFINKSILFPETEIPKKLLENNDFARSILRRKLETFTLDNFDKEVSKETLQEFLISNHEWIKWSLNIWFLVNSGTMAELVILDESVENRTLNWMREEFGVEIGQPITHPHLISENGKRRLGEAGFPNLKQHLTRDDYAEMLIACYDLSINTKDSKGFFARSWIYNPSIHTPLSDGKPFVAFNFLKYDYLSGVRKYLVTASPEGMFSDQYGFATRNMRRKQLVESGEFIPDIYAVFHTNDYFQANINAGLLLPEEL